jgi:hypothetical protein
MNALSICGRQPGSAHKRSEQFRQEDDMKYRTLAAVLAVAALFASSFVVPVEAGPYWHYGSGPTSGGM